MYHKFPQALIKDKKYKQLSNDAKLLYTVLFARSELSSKNGWIDEDAKPYIYCTREEMANLINISLPTVSRTVKQLVDAGLITAVKKNKTGSPRLYVKNLLSNAELSKSEKQDNRSYDSDELHDILLRNFINGTF